MALHIPHLLVMLGQSTECIRETRDSRGEVSFEAEKVPMNRASCGDNSTRPRSLDWEVLEVTCMLVLDGVLG
jgi:hypothetical protein